MKTRTATDADWPYLKALNEIIVYDQPDLFMHEQVKLGRVVVAEINEKVIGYALWQIIWGNTPILALLKVFPEHQKQGAGKNLIVEIEKRIKKEGFNHYMSSSTADNQSAQIYHEKMGFKNVGTLNMWHGEEVFFKKDLT